MNLNKPQAYAVKHKNTEIRQASRSGGIFSALSDAILEKGGVVYGCILTENFTAIHVKATTAEERNAMRGSKYIQSSMNDVFKAVKEDLTQERHVLFSGTSCQIAGLKGFLKTDYDNLICVDIVCHGVPSPLVWKEYLAWQEKKNNAKIVAVDFRNKRDYGWAAHVETMFFENGKKADSRVFKTLFFEHSILRPCCHQCPYKDVFHPGDITIADYWGIDKAVPGFNDNKGVSLCLLNGEKGKLLFEQVKEQLEYTETKIEDSMQPALIAPFKPSENRNLFWNDFYEKNFETVAKKYGGYGFKNDLINLLKKIKKKIAQR